MAVQWAEFVKIIDSHQSFLLTSHVRPDCDALGSELALAAALEALDKDVVIVNGQATPPNLAFIDPNGKIQALDVDVSVQDLPDAEVLIVLDTSAWTQLGPMADIVRRCSASIVVIDHHVSGDDLGAVAFKDVEAEATGRLVVEAVDQLGVKLSPDMAASLFAAVATDTGWFRFPTANGDTFRLAARLVDAGASPSTIYQRLYEQDTLGRVRLRGVVLERIVTEREGRVAHTFIRQTDFGLTGALTSDTEDLINMALGITGVQVALIFVEQPRGGFKVSFRSRCQLDCSQLAAQFGGGGHRAAAGAFVQGSLEQAQAEVLRAVRDAM